MSSSPYLDRDADFPERVIDAVVNAHMEDKVILTSFQYGLLGRIKEIRPEIRTAALFLNTESSLCPPTALWEDLGLTNGDPLLEELSGPQGLEKAVSIVENPDSVDEENGLLVRYLNDRLTALSSNYPGKNLVEILQQYYYQTDMLKYVSQFDFPLDYVGPEYHVCFRDTTLLQRAVEMGYHVAPLARGRREPPGPAQCPQAEPGDHRDQQTRDRHGDFAGPESTITIFSEKKLPAGELFLLTFPFSRL